MHISMWFDVFMYAYTCETCTTIKIMNLAIPPNISLHLYITHHSSPLPLLLLYPQAPTNLLSVSMDLPTLNISYKRNHKTCDYFCLASLTSHHVFNTSFLFMEVWVVFRCIDIPQFSYPLIHWRTFGLFPCLGSCEQRCCEHSQTSV